MSLEKASISWSAKQLKNMIVNGKIDFNHIIQRSYVWERKRKSALIESMIIGYPIPPVFAKRFDDGTGKRGGNIYCIMDGKQRLSTVAQFLNDEFALTELPPVVYMDEAFGGECETDITGMKFSELPEAIQDHLNSVIFSVTYFDNLTKKDNKNQVTLVMKAWCMMNKPIEEVSFEGKDFNPLFENASISADERLALDKVFALIHDTHLTLAENKEKAVAKKLYTETHMISLVPFFAQAVERGIEANMMADWVSDFFGSHSEEYDIAAGNGSAKNSNITTRHNVLSESFEQFFTEV